METTRIPIETVLQQELWARRLAWDLARGDGALADELVQGVYAAALTRPPSVTVPVRRWLAAVMRNLARSHRRARANRSAVEQAYAQGSRHEDAAAHAAAVLEIRRMLQRTIEDLGEPHRTRIVERYVESLKPREIASRAGVSVETVKSQLARGREALRQALDRQSGGDRSRWMAAFAPLLVDHTGLAARFQVHGAGLVASATVVASGLLAASLLLMSDGVREPGWEDAVATVELMPADAVSAARSPSRA